MATSPYPKSEDPRIEVDDRSGNPVQTKFRNIGNSDLRGTSFTAKSSEPGRLTRNEIPNVKIQTHDVSVSMTASRTQTEILVEKQIPKPTISNFVLRLIQRTGYPLELLGKSNPTKEMLETGVAVYYLYKLIRNTWGHPGLTHEEFGEITHQVLDNPNIVCYIPGDGITPRTGYLIALWTKWTVVSIDPIMDMDRVEQLRELPNLHCVREKMEDVNIAKYVPSDITDKDPIFVLLHVHSHSDFPHNWERITKLNPQSSRLGISLPCCVHVRHTLSESSVEPQADFHDPELNQKTPRSRVVIYSENVE